MAVQPTGGASLARSFCLYLKVVALSLSGELIFEWEASHVHGVWLTAGHMQYVLDHGIDEALAAQQPGATLFNVVTDPDVRFGGPLAEIGIGVPWDPKWEQECVDPGNETMLKPSYATRCCSPPASQRHQ